MHYTSTNQIHTQHMVLDLQRDMPKVDDASARVHKDTRYTCCWYEVIIIIIIKNIVKLRHSDKIIIDTTDPNLGIHV